MAGLRLPAGHCSGCHLVSPQAPKPGALVSSQFPYQLPCEAVWVARWVHSCGFATWLCGLRQVT